jgi:hypothetical protein
MRADFRPSTEQVEKRNVFTSFGKNQGDRLGRRPLSRNADVPPGSMSLGTANAPPSAADPTLAPLTSRRKRRHTEPQRRLVKNDGSSCRLDRPMGTCIFLPAQQTGRFSKTAALRTSVLSTSVLSRGLVTAYMTHHTTQHKLHKYP